jgi:hypothetical protein
MENQCYYCKNDQNINYINNRCFCDDTPCTPCSKTAALSHYKGKQPPNKQILILTSFTVTTDENATWALGDFTNPCTWVHEKNNYTVWCPYEENNSAYRMVAVSGFCGCPKGYYLIQSGPMTPSFYHNYWFCACATYFWRVCSLLCRSPMLYSQVIAK